MEPYTVTVGGAINFGFEPETPMGAIREAARIWAKDAPGCEVEIHKGDKLVEIMVDALTIHPMKTPQQPSGLAVFRGDDPLGWLERDGDMFTAYVGFNEVGIFASRAAGARLLSTLTPDGASVGETLDRLSN